MKDKSKRIEIVAKGEKKAEVLIYEDIGEGWFGGLSAKMFAEDLKGLGKLDDISVRINSPGGSVFDGVAIYNTLLNHPARVTVHVDGLAASIASIIAMAGDDVSMAENAMMMIHDPWSVVAGTASELRDQADMMDKVRSTMVSTYVSRSTAEEDTISEMMTAETWFTAAEAKEVGLIDNITEEQKMAASFNFDLSQYKNVPTNLTAKADVAINGNEADKAEEPEGASTEKETPDTPQLMKVFYSKERAVKFFGKGD